MIVRAAIMALLCFLAAITACTRHLDMNVVEGIVRMDNPSYRDKPVPRDVIEKLAPLVAQYRDRVNQYVDDAEQLQLLYKNIAQRYLDIGYYEQQVEYYVGRLKEKHNPPAEGAAGIYYDYAAIMLMERELYAAAYENIQESLKLSPTNGYLLYYAIKQKMNFRV